MTLETLNKLARLDIIDCSVFESIACGRLYALLELRLKRVKSLKKLSLHHLYYLEKLEITGCNALESINFKNLITLPELCLKDFKCLKSLNLDNLEKIGKLEIDVSCNDVSLGEVKNLKSINYGGTEYNDIYKFLEKVQKNAK